jgi:hypothetical protein
MVPKELYCLAKILSERTNLLKNSGIAVAAVK